ncbi:phosphate/phosphite/phosphonate ABC transporter substrate-binding protein [Rhodococcus sp. MS16]|uniref:phosphate/phosphite/phosphonate ABC transporter substrate-binding protein n=1 Tax=Rhodococcus sp. MS16 TaxID=2579941 RepID=UPI001562B9DE|nr:phosphate/phosphite/phosphonate ABC transporter substrate-binding protein [Rhodococcus sp. MS16]NRI65839.1 phosphate/phosphite/phosphonate ABC transporter substrate-binding protein [Rhodococcus sp. MS16]
MRARVGIAVALTAVASLALSSCSTESEASSADSNQIIFATPPGTDDVKELAIMTDVADMMGTATGKTVKHESPADYLGVVEAVRNGFVDVAVLSPFSAALAFKTGSVEPILAWNGAPDPASYCLAKSDSTIQSVTDIKGHQVAFVDPGSTTGYFMPKAMMAEAGLTDGTDYKSTFAGGHDSAVLALMNGNVDVACTARQLYTSFIAGGMFTADDVRIVGQSAPIPVGVSIVARSGLDSETRDAIKDNLPAMLSANPEASKILGVGGTYTADPDFSVYEPLVTIAEAAGVDLDNIR